MASSILMGLLKPLVVETTAAFSALFPPSLQLNESAYHSKSDPGCQVWEPPWEPQSS